MGMVPSRFFKINVLNLMLGHVHIIRIFAFKFLIGIYRFLYIYVFLKINFNKFNVHHITSISYHFIYIINMLYYIDFRFDSRKLCY